MAELEMIMEDNNVLYLRPYKKDDAKTVISWCEDETTFRKWTSDRYDSYPISEEDMNYKYFANWLCNCR